MHWQSLYEVSEHHLRPLQGAAEMNASLVTHPQAAAQAAVKRQHAAQLEAQIAAAAEVAKNEAEARRREGAAARARSAEHAARVEASMAETSSCTSADPCLCNECGSIAMYGACWLIILRGASAQAIRRQKLAQMEAAGVPAKYRTELALKKFTSAKL
jgi:hypothetical protein